MSYAEDTPFRKVPTVDDPPLGIFEDHQTIRQSVHQQSPALARPEDFTINQAPEASDRKPHDAVLLGSCNGE